MDLAAEEIVFGKGRCAECRRTPDYTDGTLHNQMTDLQGVKDSPPSPHDGRLMTLKDTIEFFNLALEAQLTQDEKHALLAFLLTL